MLRLLLPAALLASAVAAQADTIDLVGGWNINWNIVTSPAASPTQEIQIQNLTSPATNEVFNEYDLGLIFQRVEGSGQIALTASNATNPSSDSIVPSWLGAPEFGTGANTFGAGFEALIGNEALQPMNYEVPDSPASLVTVDFAPGAVAPAPGSVFDVYSDDGYSNYIDSTGTLVTPYANNTSSNFLLGTITVVPEPDSLALAGVAGAGFLIHCARRRIRRCPARAA